MSSERSKVLDRLYTCGSGKIRNPRTDRCVRVSKPLGAALHAAAQTLRTKGTLPACNKGVYDASAQQCTSDKSRAGALRELASRYRLAAGSNGNAASTAKFITSQAFAKAVAANARRGDAQLAEYLEEMQAMMLDMQRRLTNAESQRNRYRKDLDSARAQLRQLQSVMLA